MPRRLWVSGLAAVVVVALGAYVFQRVGWQRLTAQVTREVVTEDAYARAGDAAMVRSFLAPDDQAWSALRAAEARPGLAVTLPGGHMRLLDEAPRVEAVSLVDGQVYEASVLRAFTDSSGQIYHFRYPQRYRSPAPGVWERLPTDQAALALQGRWTGERLVAIFPMTDWPWMELRLARIDQWLAQACADWDCPDRLVVPITFTGAPDELRPLRAAATAPQAGPLRPIVFDLRPQRPLFPTRVILPSLQVAGTPVEDTASEALMRAVTVHGLMYLAEQLAGLSGDSPDFYLDALVARAEARLRVTPELVYKPPPDAYVPPPGLWGRGLAGRAVALPQALPYRLQALAFLNFALDGQPAEVDGALLRGLRRQPGLVPWLTVALGPEAARLPAAWTERVITASAPGTPLSWQRLDGLIYTCADGAWLVRGRTLEPLWTGSDAQSGAALSLSADGRHLAALSISNTNGWGQLNVLAVDTGAQRAVAEARFIALLGWSAEGRLLYLKSDNLDDGARGVRLWRYDPATGSGQLVITNTIRPLGLAAHGASEANWSPERAVVALTVNMAVDHQPVRWEAALVRVEDLGETHASGQALAASGPESLAEGSYAPILAPDGQSAAYGRRSGPRAGELVELIALDTHTRTVLVTAADLALGHAAGEVGLPDRLLPLAWSPDGRELLFLASGADFGEHLFTVGTDGQGLRRLAGASEPGWVSPLGFSADGRYLGYFAATLADPTVFLHVLDNRTGAVQQISVFPGRAAWSASGHLLALAAEDGAYVLDPATGDRRWLAFQSCQRVSW